MSGATLMFFGASGTSAIPEPSTYAAVLGAGALAFAAWRRRRLHRLGSAKSDARAVK